MARYYSKTKKMGFDSYSTVAPEELV